MPEMITLAELRNAVKAGLLKAGKTIRDDARDSLPKRTGRLRRGLLFGLDRGHKVALRIGWPASPFYARFIEYGRKASTKTTRPTRARALRIGNSGEFRASSRGSSLPAGKHLERAVESRKGQQVIEEEITKAITPLFRDIVFDKTGKARFK